MSGTHEEEIEYIWNLTYHIPYTIQYIYWQHMQIFHNNHIKNNN